MDLHLIFNITNSSPIGKIRAKFNLLTIGETDTDIFFDANTNIEEIIEKFKPKSIIFWGPEYNSIPEGFEKLSTFLIAVVGDWNLSFNVLKSTLKYFDLILTDKFGVNTFQQLGYKNVIYWKGNGYDPDIFKIISELPKIYDISFIGTINNDIHRKREKYLHRIRKLNDKYKVNISSSVFGDNYVQMLNQSKIVFNFGVRKELNMRFYESCACGALAFSEEDNLEVKEFFENKKDCVYYNEKNFEELLEYYLKNEKERNYIISNALVKIKKETYEEHFKYLFKLIEKLEKSAYKRTTLVEPEKDYYQAISIIQSVTNYKNIDQAITLLENLVKKYPNNSEYWNTYALALANKALNSSKIEKHNLLRKAFRFCSKALTINSNDSIIYFNLGNISLAMEQKDIAKEKFLKALDLLESKSFSFICLYLFFPQEFNLFSVEFQNIFIEFLSNKESLKKEYQKLLSWKIAERLGILFLESNQLEDAEPFFIKSINSRPDLASFSLRKLAYLYTLCGKNSEANDLYKEALSIEPFNLDSWGDYLHLLNNFNKEGYKILYNELLKAIDISPFYKVLDSGLRSILNIKNRLEKSDLDYLEFK